MKQLKRYAKVNPWRLFEERAGGKARLGIRRWVVLPNGQGTNERYPRNRYQDLLDNPAGLEELVRRLNKEEFGEQQSIENILDRNAFLSPKLLDEYERHIRIKIPNADNAQAEIARLKNYVINFFVGKKGLVNPKDWYRKQDDWAEFLLGPDSPPAASTKRKIVHEANRFIEWLHKIRPNEMPLYRFDPLTQARLREVEFQRSVMKIKKVRRDISDADWKIIKEALPEDIKPWIMLCYHYGLRRSEALGLSLEGTDCIMEDGIELKQQLTGYDRNSGQCEYGKLKTEGRLTEYQQLAEKRFIPHKLGGADPNDTYEWIRVGKEKCLMHPDTLTKRWSELMDKLKLDYDVHELRHTWITRARASFPAREVQLAAGHRNISTTERYSHDHREPSRKKFRPKAA
jgi:integrase